MSSLIGMVNYNKTVYAAKCYRILRGLNAESGVLTYSVYWKLYVLYTVYSIHCTYLQYVNEITCQ